MVDVGGIRKERHWIKMFVTFSTFTAEILSGLFLTASYAPDISEIWYASANLLQEVEFVSAQNLFLFTLFIALLSATLAYIVFQKFPRYN